MIRKGLACLDDFGGIEDGFGDEKFKWVGDFASLGEFEVFVVGKAALFLQNGGNEVQLQSERKKQKAAGTTIAVGEGVDTFEACMSAGEKFDSVSGLAVCGVAPVVDKLWDFDVVCDWSLRARNADGVIAIVAGVGDDAVHHTEMGGFNGVWSELKIWLY